MTRRPSSTPTPVGALLVAAFPPIAEGLTGLALTREWSALVGPEVARRARPGLLRAGTLEVIVDNSPWLQELSLRRAELLARLQARFGAGAVRALRFSLDAPSA
jgi:predicted nucleic acid-binding Zn ribbon protein